MKEVFIIYLFKTVNRARIFYSRRKIISLRNHSLTEKVIPYITVHSVGKNGFGLRQAYFSNFSFFLGKHVLLRAKLGIKKIYSVQPTKIQSPFHGFCF